ncbi:MAG: hypothetical protein WD851_17165 [Pirellulales bacterium]
MIATNLPDPIHKAIDSILDYLWDDEARGYRASSKSEREGHIFAELMTIRRWLTYQKKVLDKSFHTVAPRCLQTTTMAPEVSTPLPFVTFTKTRCAFAAEMRLPERSVRVTTYAANTRGRA